MNDATKIIKVRKSRDGDITDVMLTDGNVYSIDKAIRMVRDHKIDGVNIKK